MIEETPRFKPGDIIRYFDGISAIFKYSGTFNAGCYYGEHVLGGIHSSSDRIWYKLKLADEKDIEFCKKQKPEWFK